MRLTLKHLPYRNQRNVVEVINMFCHRVIKSGYDQQTITKPVYIMKSVKKFKLSNFGQYVQLG